MIAVGASNRHRKVFEHAAYREEIFFYVTLNKQSELESAADRAVQPLL